MDEIVSIHSDIVEDDEDATVGIRNEGQIDYILSAISEGHFGCVPETIHEKAAELLRLLAANHPFVDGNKRTALNTTWTFYAMNGLYFDYGEEIKAILKLFAVMEEMVDFEAVVSYFDDITYSSADSRSIDPVIDTIHLTNWYISIDDRFEEIIDIFDEYDSIEDGEFVDEIPEEVYESIDGKEFRQLLVEYGKFGKELSSLKQEYEEDFPDEVLESITALLDEWKEVRSVIIEMLSKYDPDLEGEIAENLVEEGVIDENDVN
ncbi:type II toxin-antitoxin system death-on-curing family toxin [Natronomonas salina]|uniref:type II toxin-antitoxin system death-on-curing family toxin n=1 Tax=Natronomonas salina TaxID=1710540 RepID=UPI001BAD5CB1|nr:type II toxin-antitoxin system death-on-curing family toxin [Natronomonas salina]